MLASAARGGSRMAARLQSTRSASTLTHNVDVDKTTIIATPKAGHSATVFMMHGLGDTAFGWADAVIGVYGAKMPHVKFVLPTAPTRPVTLNGGFEMPAWYDIEGLSGDRSTERCDGIDDSRNTIEALMTHEVVAHDIPYSRIVLAGFSQGGALSLYTSLLLPHTLAGVVVQSGYLPLASRVAELLTDEAKAAPMLFQHGEADPMVLLSWGKQSAEGVEEMGVESVEFRSYPGLEHSASIEELDHALAFLQRVLPADAAL